MAGVAGVTGAVTALGFVFGFVRTVAGGMGRLGATDQGGSGTELHAASSSAVPLTAARHRVAPSHREGFKRWLAGFLVAVSNAAMQSGVMVGQSKSSENAMLLASVLVRIHLVVLTSFGYRHTHLFVSTAK